MTHFTYTPCVNAPVCRGTAFPDSSLCFSCEVVARGGPPPAYQRGTITVYRGKVEDISPWWIRKGTPIFDAPYSEHVHSKSVSGDGKRVSKTNDLKFISLTAPLRRYLAKECVRLTDRWAMVFSDERNDWLWRVSMMAGGNPEVEQRIAFDLLNGVPVDESTLPGLLYIRQAFWRKIGGTPQMDGKRPATAAECITLCHAKDSKLRWNGGGKHGCWDDDSPLWYDATIVLERGGAHIDLAEPRLHTTQKPERILQRLTEDFTDGAREVQDPDLFTLPPSLIYDFTAGSCTGALGARKAVGGARFWVGCEMDPAVETGVCKACDKNIKEHRLADHDFDSVVRPIWIERGIQRLDADFDTTTFHAKKAKQEALFKG